MKINLILDGVNIKVDVDDEISELVITMNKHGYNTYASCQGHLFPVDKLKPYIAFTSSVEKAALLEKKLREDIESPSGKLKWFWCISGGFNGDYELVYSLAPHNPTKKVYKYWRKSLEQDFKAIQTLISGKMLDTKYESIADGSMIFKEDKATTDRTTKSINKAIDLSL